MNTHVVLVTAPDLEQAQALAEKLVTEKLAACVNILPGLLSVYVWQERLQQDSEALMIIKTSASKLKALESRVLELHPYDTPEFVALETGFVTPKYQAWLDGVVQS